MTRGSRSLVLCGLLLVPVASLRPQAFAVGRESKVLLLGKSNINSWRCEAARFDANVTLDSVARAVRLVVTVPVRTMDCGHARMNDDLYRALKADSFPEIRYELTSYQLDSARAPADSIFIRSVGVITVAGVSRRVEIPVRAQRHPGGDVSGEGGVRILMTDFGIRPPTAFFGAIRAKNALEVRVEAQLREPTFAAARSAPPSVRRSSSTPAPR